MIPGQYDLAISFIGPHYIMTDRVNAKIKIDWIHTDYRMIPINGRDEEAMWSKLDYIFRHIDLAASMSCCFSRIRQILVRMTE
jgi:hypothetical protein